MGDNYYRFFPGDFLRDTLDLTAEQDGMYRRLLDHVYSGQKVPADEEGLFRMTRCRTSSECESVRYVVGRYFTKRGPYYFNKRAEQELACRREFLSAQKERGKRGAAKRWENRDGERHENKIANAIKNRWPNDSQPSPSPSLDLRSVGISKEVGSLLHTPLARSRGKPSVIALSKGNGRKSYPISWNNEELKFVGITPAMIERWEAAFPAVDVEREIIKANEWVATNPKKRKQNWPRFIVNWMSRAQERGGTR